MPSVNIFYWWIEYILWRYDLTSLNNKYIYLTICRTTVMLNNETISSMCLYFFSKTPQDSKVNMAIACHRLVVKFFTAFASPSLAYPIAFHLNINQCLIHCVQTFHSNWNQPLSTYSYPHTPNISSTEKLSTFLYVYNP